MSYTPRDTGEFVRNPGKGSNEGPRGMKWREKYQTIDWRSNSEADGFTEVSPKRIKKTYKLT